MNDQRNYFILQMNLSRYKGIYPYMHILYINIYALTLIWRYIWLVFLLHNIFDWRTEQKHRHILCSVQFSSKAIKIWSTFPENIRIRDAYHAKILSQKLFLCYFGMGSKRVSDFPLINSELIKTGEELDTLFDPIPK
jgi:hypothetical protein